MNNLQNQLATKEAVKGKFKGKDAIKSRYAPRYPSSSDREYQRIMRSYMKLLNDALKKRIPAIMAAYKKPIHSDSRLDEDDFTSKVRKEMLEVFKELEQKLNDFGIERFIEKVGNLTKTTTLREWKKAIRDTLGIDLLDDYYSGSYYDEYLRQWVADNVLKIKTIPQNTLDEMTEIIIDGYLNGKPIRALQKEIQEQYNVSRHKAQMFARDQIGTLNAQITKQQQKDAGCEKYTWSDSGDRRVRDCHHELNGQVFSWNDPPEMWYMTKTKGKVLTGRRCHPGEDYCCRCVAIPMFDINTVSVPFTKSE